MEESFDEEEISPRQWEAFCTAVYNAYQNGTTYDGERIVRLEMSAGGAQPPYTDRREVRFETVSGVRRRVYCHWRSFMR